MIYCVWYPSGGFGHFINAVLTLHGKNFVRPSKILEFSPNGDSHDLDLVVPKYQFGCWTEQIKFLPDKNYCVLIDNGINNESTDFIKSFTGPTQIIKICYNEQSWPIVARTLISKAMYTDLNSALCLGSDWTNHSDWAVREKYFLYLRDHAFRHAWKSDSTKFSLPIDVLLDYARLKNLLSTVGIECGEFKNLHQSMIANNQLYLLGVDHANKIINAIKHNIPMNIEHITDLWDQAVINYYIYLNFDIEIPANTYADWFANTSEINKLL